MKIIDVKPMTARDYCINHWQQYNLVDSQEAFIMLICALEVHGENLDSLHDVCINGRDEICGIYGYYEDDRDVARTILEFHVFYSLETGIEDKIARDMDCWNEPREIVLEWNEDEILYRTTNYYVELIQC